MRQVKERISKSRTRFEEFLLDTSGAVSVDMVVIVGASVGLALAVIGSISGGLENAANDIADTSSGITISTSFADDDDASSTSETGNPGNDEDVGESGEDPNDKDEMGDGIKGKSQ